MAITTKSTLRREEIETQARAVMTLLEESGLLPLEGLTVVESVYSLLLLRGMDAAKGNPTVIDMAKGIALRSLNRMHSRVLSWPARVEDDQTDVVVPFNKRAQ